jgi:hypothetical protein
VSKSSPSSVKTAAAAAASSSKASSSARIGYNLSHEIHGMQQLTRPNNHSSPIQTRRWEPKYLFPRTTPTQDSTSFEHFDTIQY